MATMKPRAKPKGAPRKTRVDKDRAFFASPHSSDGLAEQLGEEFVLTITSGEYEGGDALDQLVPEETGGPFLESSVIEEIGVGAEPNRPPRGKRRAKR